MKKKRFKGRHLLAAFLALTLLVSGPAVLAEDDEGDHQEHSGDHDSAGGGKSGPGGYNWGNWGNDTGTPASLGDGQTQGDSRDNQDNRDNRDGRDGRGEFGFLTEKVLDAQKDLAEAQARLAADPNDPEALAKLAEAYAKMGQWDQVAQMATQLEAAAAQSEDAAKMLAALKIQQGDLQGAQAILQGATEDGEASRDVYKLLGLANEKEDDWYGAFNAYEQAAQTNPLDPQAIHDLGKAYRELYKREKHRGKMHGDVELDEIPVFIDGRQVIFQDVPPQIIDNRTMVPVRKLSEALGAMVNWDPATQTVTISTPAGVKIEMTIGSNQALVNGQAVTLDVAPLIVGNRTLFPARFIAENLGFQVNWDDLYRMVTVAPAPGTVTPTTPTDNGTVTNGVYGTNPTPAP